jgi:predicted nucleic acid-binding protein
VPAIAELRRAFVAVLASSVGLVPITAEIAEAHASLRADLCRKVDLVGVNDLIIAATAAHF